MRMRLHHNLNLSPDDPNTFPLRQHRPSVTAVFLVIVLVVAAIEGTPSNAEAKAVFLLSEGDSIVLQGEVLRIASVLEEPLIVSYVTISVTRILSGPASLAGMQVILKHIGGEVNGVLLWASDQPYFAVGEIVQLSVRPEKDYYVATSPKTTVGLPPGAFRTVEGYRLYWYHPSYGWTYQASSPGSGWYGPAQWSAGGFSYYVNTANNPTGVGSADFISAVQASYQTWEDDSGSLVDLTYGGTTTATVDSHDYVVRVGWGSIGGSTIAYCHLWMSLGGSYTLPIDDADIVFDTTKSWSVTGASDTYDVQNIGTHEAGHGIGVADLYDSEDSEQTMYGYASTGETKKRTLEWGDRAGLAALYPVAVTKTATVTSTVSSTSYTTRYTTATVTSYTSTSTSTSTVPVVTTVVLLPLTVTSTVQSTQYVTSVLTTTVTSYTGTSTSTSTVLTTVVLVPLTVTSTVQSTQLLTSILTTTVTSYTGTQTSTSTIVVPTTVVLVPSTVTSTVQSTQYLTSILTTTVTSYTSTWTSTSTIPTVTTVVLLPSTVTSTIQSTQFLTSTATTTVTSYTATTTSTSTSVVYTTVTASPGGAGPAGAGASSPLAYLGFISVLAVAVVIVKPWKKPEN